MRLLVISLLLAGCQVSAVPADGGNPDTFDAGWPQLTFGGGKVLQPLRVATVVARNEPLTATLFAFGDALVQSPWLDAVGSEFGVSRPASSVHLTGGVLNSGTVLTDAQMTAFIAAAIQAAPNPPTPDGHTIYLLYLPPGVAFTGNATCTMPGAYHQGYGVAGDGWGVVQRCTATFESELEGLTVVGSHEIIEAATDPDVATGWGLFPTSPARSVSPWAQLDEGYPQENGDFCIGTRIQLGGFWYQRSYSNIAAAAGGDPCVPRCRFPTTPSTRPAIGPLALQGRRFPFRSRPTRPGPPVIGWCAACSERAAPRLRSSPGTSRPAPPSRSQATSTRRPAKVPEPPSSSTFPPVRPVECGSYCSCGAFVSTLPASFLPPGKTTCMRRRWA